jgi:pyruvate,water dikinase
MERYGHLSASGTDFTVPPWGENAGLIWRTIALLAGASGPEAGRDARRVREDARERALSRLSPSARLIFTRLLRGTVTYLGLRERISFLMSEDAFQMRRVYLAMGRRLVDRNDLHGPDDVFYLMYDELEKLLEGSCDQVVARERIEARKAAALADAEMEIDDVICGEEVLSDSPAPPEDVEKLVGIAGSRGVVRGYARIVTDPYETVSGLSDEDILVVPFMDVGWTPLFSRAGGVVAETGGQLSHSAIVAREFGLPAVVGVRKATRAIRDGQPITVDGNRGVVYLKHVD